MLIGEYRYSVDPKGRIFVPAKMREEMGDSFIVSKAMDNCLNLYSPKQWMSFSEKLTALSDIKARAVKRFIFSTAQEVNVDSQGRICIPQNLREYAGLTKEAVIIGVETRIEIWRADAYAQMESEADREAMIAFLTESGF